MTPALGIDAAADILGRSLALELAAIRFNATSPGTFLTGQTLHIDGGEPLA